MFGWVKLKKDYDKNLAVTSIGDNGCPPTRWWNHWWLVLRGVWIWAIVIEVEPSSNQHLMVGYAPSSGSPMMRPIPPTATKVAFRVGHEPCSFFAFNSEGQQVPVKLVHQHIPIVKLDPDILLV